MLGWENARHSVNIEYAPTDSVLEALRMAHFDDSGEQDFGTRCIVKRGAAANEFAADFFRRSGGGTVTATGFTIASITVGTICTWVSSDEVSCGGEHC